MPVTDQDLEAWAARSRPHFEPRLQDIAETAAGILILAVGSRVKELRPETPMAEVFAWLEDDANQRSTSLDWVEILMAVEEEVSSEATDAFAETLEQRTFREYVEHLHDQRRGV